MVATARSSRGPSPESYQRAMVFIDGTNLFESLRGAKLHIPAFSDFAKSLVKQRLLVHTYLYTTERHLTNAKAEHGSDAFKGVRVVLGFDVPAGKNGEKYREKSVDAALVADLVYHAAAKSFEYVVVVARDQDYTNPLKRVADRRIPWW